MNVKFVVMVCYYGEPCKAHRDAIDGLVRAGIPFLPVYNCPYLDIARSHACTEALKQVPDATGVVFIDHDMHGFSAEDVKGFVSRAEQGQCDIVGIGYSLRRPGFMLACQPLSQNEVVFYVPGHVEAKYVGTGFMYISRALLEPFPVPTRYVDCVRNDVKMFFQPFDNGEHYYPDDVGFCYRARAMGRKVWIDTQMRVLHRGVYDYAIEDAGWSVPNVQGPLTVRFE